MDESTPLLQNQEGMRLPRYTSSTTELYSELALPPGTEYIRLLDLQAAPLGLPGAPLTARLRVASLAEQPTFTTLSYVWGTHDSARPWHQVTILPQCVNLDITENCFLALHRIRSRVGAVTIWVDSICINQEDEKEKTAQIPLMMKIYSSARVGYNWLGESNQELDNAIQFLRLRATISARLPLAHIMASSKEQQRYERKAFILRLLRDALSRLFYHLSRASMIVIKKPGQKPLWDDHIKTLRHKGDEELDGIQQLLGHPWTRRAWTFQELVLSRNPVFLCGQNIILWEDIISATCLDDLSPGLASALRPWRSLAELWLSFPRLESFAARLQDEVPEVNEAAPYSLYTFKELLDASWLYKLRALRNGMHTVMLATCYFFCFAAAAAIIFLARQLPAGDHPKRPWPGRPEVYSTTTDPGMLILAAFVVCFIFAFLAEILVPTICGALFFILIGKLPAEGQEKEARDNIGHTNSAADGSLVINGIWTALAERASQDPRDKSFALSGILKAAGTSPALPNYSRSVRETYWKLFSDLVAWQPARAGSLMLSARTTSSEHDDGRGGNWPSWLPDWSKPEPHTWLVGRYRIDHGIHAAPIQYRATARPSLLGTAKLCLSGQFIGAIDMCVRLEAIPTANATTIAGLHTHYHDDTDTGSPIMLRSLHQITRWMRAVAARAAGLDAYDAILSSLFAILHGLTRPKQAVMLEHTFWNGRREEWETIEYAKKRWEAPYDFTDCVDDFKAFEAFYQIVLGGDGRNDSGVGGRGAGEDAVLGRLQENEMAMGYFIRIVNRLADDKRGLFILWNGMGGSGSWEMLEGDHVLLAAGIRAPILVRELRSGAPGTTTDTSTAWRFLAPVLVHGIMYGEEFREESLVKVELE